MGMEELNTGVAHSARVYDYLLGGKDHFRADRDVAEEVMRCLPSLPVSMQANRSYMVRVSRHLAAEHGLRQFLDIGAGLPSAPNLHEVVQAVDPRSRVVYVDNDPIVLAYARALLNGLREGATSFVHADLHDVEAILGSPVLHASLDLSRPVAVSLIAILQYVTDEAEARKIVSAVMSPLAPGSTLALSVVTGDADPAVTEAMAIYNTFGLAQKARDHAEVVTLFEGLELLEPGVVPVHRWHPDDEARSVPDEQVHVYGGVAVKR
jgi:O-methyltransferase involved in polyketide biosynthesis